MKTTIITTTLCMMLITGYAQQTIREFVKGQHSRYDHYDSEDEVSAIALLQSTDYNIYTENIMHLRPRARRGSSSNSESLTNQNITLWQYDFQNETNYLAAIDSLLKCFGADCVPIWTYSSHPSRVTPSVYVFDQNSIYIASTPCKNAGPKWHSFKQEFIRFFDSENASILVTDCGLARWERSQFPRGSSVSPTIVDETTITQDERPADVVAMIEAAADAAAAATMAPSEDSTPQTDTVDIAVPKLAEKSNLQNANISNYNTNSQGVQDSAYFAQMFLGEDAKKPTAQKKVPKKEETLDDNHLVIDYPEPTPKVEKDTINTEKRKNPKSEKPKTDTAVLVDSDTNSTVDDSTYYAQLFAGEKPTRKPSPEKAPKQTTEKAETEKPATLAADAVTADQDSAYYAQLFTGGKPTAQSKPKKEKLIREDATPKKETKQTKPKEVAQVTKQTETPSPEDSIYYAQLFAGEQPTRKPSPEKATDSIPQKVEVKKAAIVTEQVVSASPEDSAYFAQLFVGNKPVPKTRPMTVPYSKAVKTVVEKPTINTDVTSTLANDSHVADLREEASRIKNQPKKIDPTNEPLIGKRIRGDFDGDGQLEVATVVNLKDELAFSAEDRVADNYQVQFSTGELEPIDAGCCDLILVNEGDLDGNGTDEISIYQAPRHGCTYSMTTYTEEQGFWEMQVPTFLIPTDCQAKSAQWIQKRVYRSGGSIYYLDTLPNNPGRLTPILVNYQ